MLLVNYVLNSLDCPIFVFRLQEKEELQNAVQDEHKMRLYIGQKLRENVRIQGRLYALKEDYEGLSARYVDPQTQEEILVEWHPLYMSLY